MLVEKIPPSVALRGCVERPQGGRHGGCAGAGQAPGPEPATLRWPPPKARPPGTLESQSREPVALGARAVSPDAHPVGPRGHVLEQTRRSLAACEFREHTLVSRVLRKPGGVALAPRPHRVAAGGAVLPVEGEAGPRPLVCTTVRDRELSRVGLSGDPQPPFLRLRRGGTWQWGCHRPWGG